MSDNGLEFFNFQSCSSLVFFARLRVIHQNSHAKTSQQNRVVEKQYHNLLNTAYALRF
jgi:hypothetical protein